MLVGSCEEVLVLVISKGKRVVLRGSKKSVASGRLLYGKGATARQAGAMRGEEWRLQVTGMASATASRLKLGSL
ncbi:hypothetical protein MA16_Dca024881 [Dendrobium catenatum]|uniref:Uncharacterized protein n=1 Tax=Dendrobium catenatum TaxID=906689 RepID=A0A2I0VQA8_9ASPA|nr:hypothetical protein MA16_Dca024881 [Dendrobium catenatum]